MVRQPTSRHVVLIIIVVLMLPVASTIGMPPMDNPQTPSVREDVPAPEVNGFLENGGQVDDDRIRFYSWNPSGGMALTDDGVIMTVVDGENGVGANVVLEFDGASPSGAVGNDPLPGATNFLRGQDPSAWCKGLRTYQEVLYPDLYPGIDLVYRIVEGRVKYDLVLRPDADLSEFRVQVSGHLAMDVDPVGDLVIGTAAGPLRDGGLLAYYADDPGTTVDCSFELRDENAFGFSIGTHDEARTIVIDPVIYSTFVGGAVGELEVPTGGPVLDSSDRPVVLGFSNTSDFPTTPGAFETSAPGGEMDLFVFRLSADGTDLEWSTYIGGTGSDYPYDMAMELGDRPVIVGRTNSTDFPTTMNAYRASHSGPDQEGFVLRLSADGSDLDFATYIGGNDTDEVTAIVLDGDHYFFAGNTKSLDLPTSAGAHQMNHSGGVFDIFMGSLRSGGHALEWLSYFGGDQWDIVADMDGDLLGDLVFVGQTRSEGLATNGTFQNATNGSFDAFVGIMPRGGGKVHSFTYFGGFMEDMAQFVDASDHSIRVAGFTESGDFPTTNGSYQTIHEGSADVFVVSFPFNLTNITSSTLFGGTDWEICEGFAMGPDSTVYITGRTLSDDLPMPLGTYQDSLAGSYDAFVARLSSDLSQLLYCSYLGGSAMDIGSGIVVDAGGNATIVGGTDSRNFPTTAGSYQPTHGGRVDAFVTKMDLFLDLEPPFSRPGMDVAIDQHETVHLDGSNSTDNVAIVNWTWSFFYNSTDVDLYGLEAEWTFDLAGYYHINLTVRDAVGLWDKNSVLVLVRDIEAPVAVTPNDMIGQQHWTVTLDGGGSYDNMGIVAYSWIFEYNHTAQTLLGKKVDFSFRLAGEYTITLVVTDAAGNWDSANFTITILDTTDPIADAGPDIEADQYEAVVFNGTASQDNVGIVNITWQFIYAGAPISLFGNVTTFVFERPGVYDVNLIIEDAVANRGFDRLVVRVRDSTPPVAVAGFDTTIDQGSIVSLDARSSSDDVGIVGWTWSITFKGETTSFSGQLNAITLNAAGVHLVELNVSDAAGNWDKDSFKVNVRDITPPDAEAGENLVVSQGDTVWFDGNGSHDNVGIISWTWTFKDGNDTLTLTGPSPEHTFEGVGTYLVTLTVLDGSGLTALDQLQVSVIDTELPRPDPGDPMHAFVGETITFNGTNSTDNVLVELYLWSFNYNLAPVELAGARPTFTFELKGTYIITLTVTDSSGNEASSKTLVEVVSKDDGGGGGGGGTDGDITDLLPWLLVAAIAIVILVVVVKLRSRKEPEDLGWAPTDDEKKERENGDEDAEEPDGTDLTSKESEAELKVEDE